jgi:iron complex transport system substrate-binding protein
MRINLHHRVPVAALFLCIAGSGATAADNAHFPLQINHALGQTAIVEKPQRVATV